LAPSNAPSNRGSDIVTSIQISSDSVSQSHQIDQMASGVLAPHSSTIVSIVDINETVISSMHHVQIESPQNSMDPGEE
jgi:hypothetical protein